MALEIAETAAAEMRLWAKRLGLRGSATCCLRRSASLGFWFLSHETTSLTTKSDDNSKSLKLPPHAATRHLFRMPHLRTSKLWLALTPSRKPQQDSIASKSKGHDRRTRSAQPAPRPLVLTIGNGKLPIELLQQIFAHLDFLTLLCCRHVSRLWAHSLPSSFSNLYNTFLPRNNRALGPAFPNLHIHINFRITITRHFQHDAARITCTAITCADPRVAAHPLHTHPLLTSLDQTVVYEHRRLDMFVPLFPQLGAKKVFPWTAGLEPENWKCMELCVPPVGSATVVCGFKCSEGNRRRDVIRKREVSHGGDIRVGRVVGEVEEMVAWTLKEWFY